MKVLSLNAFLGSVVLLGLVGFGSNAICDEAAHGGEISAATPAALPEPGLSRFQVEADVQAHSVAGEGSPWVGIGGSYRFSETFQVGLRGFMPASRPVDESTYAGQLFGRLRFRRGQSTDLFVESDFAENFYHFNPWPSAGLAVGAINRFAPGLGFGVMGGFEMAHYVLDSMGIEDRTDLIVYPKVSLIANFIF